MAFFLLILFLSIGRSDIESRYMYNINCVAWLRKDVRLSECEHIFSKIPPVLHKNCKLLNAIFSTEEAKFGNFAIPERMFIFAVSAIMIDS